MEKWEIIPEGKKKNDQMVSMPIQTLEARLVFTGDCRNTLRLSRIITRDKWLLGKNFFTAASLEFIKLEREEKVVQA